jgi:hypothetical protein
MEAGFDSGGFKVGQVIEGRLNYIEAIERGQQGTFLVRGDDGRAVAMPRHPDLMRKLTLVWARSKTERRSRWVIVKLIEEDRTVQPVRIVYEVSSLAEMSPGEPHQKK